MPIYKKWSVISLILTLALFPVSSIANPTMFVKEERTGTWESDLILLPNSTQDSGVKIIDINNFIKNRLALRAVDSPLENYTPICWMNFARPQDIAGSDRSTVEEINADLKEFPRNFDETWTTGGEVFKVRVGIFEDCKSEKDENTKPLRFMALVVNDSSGAIREFDATDWSFIRIFKRQDGLINILGCFACGEVRELRYNPEDKEFYFKWVGH